MDLKNSEYWFIFRDTWTFFKDALPVHPKNDGEYWKRIADQTIAIGKQYKETKQYDLAATLVLATLRELEAIADRNDVRYLASTAAGSVAHE